QSVSAPARIAAATKYISPALEVPVAFSSSPIAYGPANPPRLPVELIRPTATAPARPLTRLVVRDQRPEMNVVSPAVARQRKGISSARCPLHAMAPTNPTAPAQPGPTVCQRRSPVRSEDQPARSIAIRAVK